MIVLRRARRRGGRARRRRACPCAGSRCPGLRSPRLPASVARSSNSVALGTTPCAVEDVADLADARLLRDRHPHAVAAVAARTAGRAPTGTRAPRARPRATASRRSPRALTARAAQVALQQVRGGARVLGRAARRAPRERRREALVVGLDRHRRARSARRSAKARASAACGALLAGEADRQPDHDRARPRALRPAARSAPSPRSEPGSAIDVERRRERAGRVADRAAAAGAAVVERQDAGQA